MAHPNLALTTIDEKTIKGEAAVNNILTEGNDSCIFATVFCAILNTETGEVRFGAAGHNLPLVMDAQGMRYLAVKPGFVLGHYGRY
ncbi:Stage II sporulation protein E (SpoIIE) [Geoalkalibacter ferrihydriticus]|uniref:PPM-type phosphatase domain-containing protein n=2 Tax=Geoalkalibacter ferrihydriticus TaxID=392333 RepID=A0A0C2HPK5_9BACT|nr:SpoIIE family protein phosphatase [Geoalkalibacter ferrihydriticus]KIH76880.1 hypothetical protein GFER_07205 [Geoalkalibacter ferrihydriticus DSM 17813]SDL46343.1 Stage II sporulation protein E (SpoIIE) [Geoalkalibacter ferrihydriticus]